MEAKKKILYIIYNDFKYKMCQYFELYTNYGAIYLKKLKVGSNIICKSVIYNFEKLYTF